jgi:hypothetical protein
MLLLVGVVEASSVKHRPPARSNLRAIHREKRLGPKPTPHWYWRWTNWRLGEGFAKSHPHQRNLRPKQAPRRIPRWAWRRLHFFLLARRLAHKPDATTRPTGTGSTSTTQPIGNGSTNIASGAAENYQQAISYTRTPPAFTPTRTINVASASALETALSNLEAGDLVKATAPFTVSSSSTNALAISNKLTADAVIDLGSFVSFRYTGTGAFSAMWINNPSHIQIYGGDLATSSTGGTCISWYGGQHVTWWGFTAHDCGGTGIGVTPTKAFAYPVENDDIEGDISHTGLNPALDPHTEKCSGLHGANLDDSNTAVFDHNRFAFNVHDSGCIGGGIEFGSNQASPLPDHNTIILQCTHFTFVSTIQTGGNCYQTWGYGETNTDIQYLNASDLTGHAYTAGGLYSGVSLATDIVDYGRATSTRLNSWYANDPNWDPKGGTVFKDVPSTP